MQAVKWCAIRFFLSKWRNGAARSGKIGKVYAIWCVTRDDQMSIFSLRPVQTGGLGSVFLFSFLIGYWLLDIPNSIPSSLAIGYWIRLVSEVEPFPILPHKSITN